VALIAFNGASVDDQRPSRMIGDETVVLEANGVGSSRFGKIRAGKYQNRLPQHHRRSCFLSVDRRDTRGAVEHKGPFSGPVPMQFTNATAFYRILTPVIFLRNRVLAQTLLA
jgi:hypothetical protein